MITYSIAPSEYTFNVSVSTTTHGNKEDFEAVSNKLVYRKQSADIDTLCKLIKEGHSFCHCYDDDDDIFTNSTKKDNNFRYTSFIPYDIDNNTLTMEEYLTTLTFQPTIAYTTTSNGLEGKGFRYRLIYCFDGKIKGVERYQALFEAMQVESGIGKLDDNCTHSPAQAFFEIGRASCRERVCLYV